MRVAEAARNLRRRHKQALGELHPMLRERVEALLADLDGRAMCWTGYRGPAEQEQAYREGNSAARWLQSPHNYRPALAVDVAWDPERVELSAHPTQPEWPNLWDPAAPWDEVERLARVHGLARVSVRGRRDLPHLELPNWRRLRE